MKYLLVILGLIAFSNCSRQGDDVISLAGSWQFSLDPEDVGLSSGWNDKNFENQIKLPGTTDEAGYGTITTDTAYGVLSREYEYIGVAWYSRMVTIPASWEEQELSLLLERVLWESKVFVDGEFKGTQDALGTPHRHNLGVLSPGKHRITLRINNDMIHNIGDKGHAYGDYMQSIWNGVVGRIELRAKNPIYITQVRTFPQGNNQNLKVEITTQNPAGDDLNYLITLREKKSQKIIDITEYLTNKEKFVLELKPEHEIHHWTEFDPFLYELVVQINPPLPADKSVTTFGFANVSHNQHHILINNEPVFLRGNLDCIHFPLTGYPAMDVDSWKKIFGKYKEYGLNHVRFHSWCPPDAAFTAADELGIYIQAEASVWIDWWMGVDMVERGRPEMNTKGHPQGIGRGDTDSDDFIRAEMQRMVDAYGNHPSFVMFCIGNELGSSDFNLMGQWIKELKEYDPRRLYAASTARTITPFCDFSATHNVPGVGGVRQRLYNNKNWNYEDHYSKATVPIIAHEVGQWPIYPEWSEIQKYTGVLKPRNLEQLAQLAREKGIYDQDKNFRLSSGKLSALLYKDEIESFMRTRSCAGYQLLSMQDYIGQGEALIGWLDSFYDSKGVLNPDIARHYMNSVVPLISLPSYIFVGGDTLNIKTQLQQFGPSDLRNQIISWQLLDQDNQIIQSNQFSATNYPKGALHDIGNLFCLLPDVARAKSFVIKLVVEGTDYQNSWPIWVYPKALPKLNDGVIISTTFDQALLDSLHEGSSVLLLAHKMGNPDNRKLAAWKPLYWSASFFPGQSIETLGLMPDPSHPALADFPTGNFGSWNWWNICKNAHGFILDDAPAGYKAIIRPISDFHYNHRLGSLFETRVGKGKLLICGYDLSHERDSFPEVRQLRYSLLKYMNSDAFKPGFELDSSLLFNLLLQTGSNNFGQSARSVTAPARNQADNR